MQKYWKHKIKQKNIKDKLKIIELKEIIKSFVYFNKIVKTVCIYSRVYPMIHDLKDEYKGGGYTVLNDMSSKRG